MFDAGTWEEYLMEFQANAAAAGASPCDIIQLLQMALARELVVAKASEVLHGR